jgi:hypothetical protein
MNFLGSYVASMTAYNEDWTGAMSSAPVRLTNGTAAQILVGPRPTIYKIVLGTAPVLPHAPVVATPAELWALDDASGTTAVDSVNASGNLTVPTDTKISWVSGKYNTALALGGTEATTTNVPSKTSQSYSATVRNI